MKRRCCRGLHSTRTAHATASNNAGRSSEQRDLLRSLSSASGACEVPRGIVEGFGLRVNASELRVDLGTGGALRLAAAAVDLAVLGAERSWRGLESSTVRPRQNPNVIVKYVPRRIQ